MSGIAGIIRLDGAAADAQPLLHALTRRGRDGATRWSSGGAALVHALLRTTPADSGVFVDGDLVITADARIDEHDGAAPRASGRSHAAVIADAWRKWGDACPSHLEGDFAFAIWDASTRTLFCARDHFGVKPFVYAHVPDRFFAFASDVRTLLALPELPRELERSRIEAYLTIRFDDAESTFYRAVRRLPGAHTLTVRDGQLFTRRYWSMRDVAPQPVRSDAEYAAGYREHFMRAVRERMSATSLTEIGAMLSGGLDSTAIACVARDELRAAGAGPLPVFSWIFSDAMDADEREYQEPVIAAGGLRPFTLDSAVNHASPWTDLEELLPDGPPFAPNHYLNVGMARTAVTEGVRILLDGLAGDITVSRGSSTFVELFLKGRLLRMTRELRALRTRRGSDESLLRLFAVNVGLRIAPPALLRLAGRRVAARQFRSVREEQLWQFESPFIGEGLELSDRMIAGLGVEGRYPFLDRRLAEYCLSLPADQKLSDGYSRIVARRAMEGIVPDEVRWRAGKGAPGLHIVHALRESRRELDDFILRDADAVAEWTAIDPLLVTHRELMEGKPVNFQAVVRLWSAATLGRWLRVHR